MGLILQILVAIVAAIVLAIIIVKFLPLKLRWIASLLLLVATVFLANKIYNGIMEPIKFNKEKVERYTSVISNLKVIRNAEVRHYEVTGEYTKNKAELIQFIDSGKIAITETRDTIIKVRVGGGIVNDVEKKVTDTIGYEPVSKYFKNVDYKNMFKVPGVEGKEFDLEVATVEKVQGLIVPTFEAKTEKSDILKGLSKSLLKQELEQIATDQIKGEYVSVGSLNEVTTAGNWPPSYDKNESAKKNN